MDNKLVETFGKRIRVRACGICVRDNKILLVGHSGLIENGLYWCPPGGGVNFGETASSTVVREMWEETNLTVSTGPFMFLKEFVAPPLHAIELYFMTNTDTFQSFQKGRDPELENENQLIRDVCFKSLDEINELPSHCVDPIFRKIRSLAYLCDEQNWSTIQKELI